MNISPYSMLLRRHRHDSIRKNYAYFLILVSTCHVFFMHILWINCFLMCALAGMGQLRSARQHVSTWPDRAPIHPRTLTKQWFPPLERSYKLMLRTPWLQSICISLMIPLFLLVVMIVQSYNPLMTCLSTARSHMYSSNRRCLSKLDNNPTNRLKRTCKRCRQQYVERSGSGICISHPGIYSGRLNRVNDVDTSDKEFFWSCCGNYDLSAPGCLILDEHHGYDDEEDECSFSVFTGKRVGYKRL